MAGEETQELEIKIIPDEDANLETAVKAEEKVAAKAEPKAEVEVKDPAVQDLMAQYKALEEREQAATRRASMAEQEAARHKTEIETARKQVTHSQLDTVTTARNAAKADADAAKLAIRAAKEAGDVEAEIEAQDRLAQARADERRLDEAISDLEARAKAPPRRQEPVVPSDPVEAYVQGRTAPTANWLRAHPEFIREPRRQHKLTAAHEDAMGEGLAVDTPEYFAHVEKFLGITKGEAVTKNPTEAAQVRTKASAPVAPGSSVANGGNGSGGSVVTLTQREANAAVDGTIVWNWDDPKGKFKKGDPIGHTEMARRKVAMQKQGLYDKSQFEA